MTNQTNLTTISSVPMAEVPEGKTQIVASWKSTEKRSISPQRAKRAIILSSTLWSNDPSVTSITTDVLKLHILDSVADLAREYLSTIVEESDWTRTEVPIEHFTLSALLNWNAERAAMSGRLNGDEIRNWIKQSFTVRSVTELHGSEVGKAFGETLVKLASPNHGITQAQATKLLSSLWKEEDAETTTGLRVQLKLSSIAKKETTANVLDSII